MTKESVIERVKKLLAHADSARSIGNADEAAAFAGKAEELLLNHKLGMTDLEVEEQKTSDPVGKGERFTPFDDQDLRRAEWFEHLVSGIASANFCKWTMRTGTRKIRLIGKKSDRDIAEYLIKMLSRLGEDLALKHYLAVRKAAYARGEFMPKKSQQTFLLGFAAAIVSRLLAMRKEVEVTGGQYAVTRFNNAEQEVKDFYATLDLRPSAKINQSYGDPAHMEAGRKAGNAAPISPGLGQSKSTNGTLAKGQQLLGGGK